MSIFTPRIHLLQVMNRGLIQLSYNGDVALWSRCKVRKRHRCVLTDEQFESGDEMFRPVGNQEYRMRRIAAYVIDSMIDHLMEKGELSDEEIEALRDPDAP